MRGPQRSWRSRELVFLLGVIVFPGAGCTARAAPLADGVTLVAATSLIKVPRRGPFGGEAALRAQAARGEYESVQLVVRAGAMATRIAEVRASDLLGPAGARLPAPRIYRVGYVRITTPSNIEGWAGDWPDPLYPDL